MPKLPLTQEKKTISYLTFSINKYCINDVEYKSMENKVLFLRLFLYREQLLPWGRIMGPLHDATRRQVVPETPHR